MSSHRYHTRSARTAGDPLARAAALVASGVFGRYTVTERAGTYTVAGDVLAEVRAQDGVLHRTVDGAHTATPFDARMSQLSEALQTLPIEGWRAHGWVAFELSLAAAGLPHQGTGPLAHLVVPRYEVTIDAATVTVRGVDRDGTAQLLELAVSLDPEPEPTASPTPVDLTVGGEQYRESVARAVAAIGEGALQKVILSRVVHVDGAVDLLASYVRARRANTPARSFLLDLGDIRAAGFSPEVVATVADGVVTTQPLAGTRALTGDPATDRRLRDELLSDPKEIHEHAVSVKSAVDELDTVCEPGSVHVEGFMNVLERGSVQHLGSRVLGRLRAGNTAWDALEAVFPPVTAAGVPRLPAYQYIRDLEQAPRGLYSGAVVTVDADGGMDAALVLRTIYQSGDRTWLRAGAGIVGASRPEREYEETCEKLRSVSGSLVVSEKTALVGGS